MTSVTINLYRLKKGEVLPRSPLGAIMAAQCSGADKNELYFVKYLAVTTFHVPINFSTDMARTKKRRGSKRRSRKGSKKVVRRSTRVNRRRIGRKRKSARPRITSKVRSLASFGSKNKLPLKYRAIIGWDHVVHSWAVVGENNQSGAYNITWEDMQHQCPQFLSFITSYSQWRIKRVHVALRPAFTRKGIMCNVNSFAVDPPGDSITAWCSWDGAQLYVWYRPEDEMNGKIDPKSASNWALLENTTGIKKCRLGQTLSFDYVPYTPSPGISNAAALDFRLKPAQPLSWMDSSMFMQGYYPGTYPWQFAYRAPDHQGTNVQNYTYDLYVRYECEFRKPKAPSALKFTAVTAMDPVSEIMNLEDAYMLAHSIPAPGPTDVRYPGCDPSNDAWVQAHDDDGDGSLEANDFYLPRG